MSGKRVFVDTNILLYALDSDAGPKHEKAGRRITELWEGSSTPILSIQVLQELYVNLIRKKVSQPQAQSAVMDYLAWEVIPLDTGLFGLGLKAHREWKLSFWDGLIVAAANQAQADWLLTEDMNHGQIYGKVKVVNPFKPL